jgi:hypothetical protein
LLSRPIHLAAVSPEPAGAVPDRLRGVAGGVALGAPFTGQSATDAGSITGHHGSSQLSALCRSVCRLLRLLIRDLESGKLSGLVPAPNHELAEHVAAWSVVV